MVGFPWVKIVAGLILLGLGYLMGHGVGYKAGYSVGDTHGRDVATASYEGALKQQRDQAQSILDAAIADNGAIRKKYDDLQALWKVDHAIAESTKDDLSGRLRAALDANGRLRDPRAAAPVRRACSGDAGKAGAADPGVRSNVPAEAGGVLPEDAVGLLSPDLSRLLQRITREADDVLTVANECAAAARLK